jgi:hypothetical protein
LQRQGNAILLLVFALLVCGVLIFIFAAELARNDVQTTDRFKSLDEIDAQLDAIEKAFGEAKSPSIAPEGYSALRTSQGDASKLVAEWREVLTASLVVEELAESTLISTNSAGQAAGEVALAVGEVPPRALDLQQFVSIGVLLPMRFYLNPDDPRSEGYVTIMLPTLFRSRAPDETIRRNLAASRDQLIAIADKWRTLHVTYQDEFGMLSAQRQRLLASGEERAIRLDGQFELLKQARDNYLRSFYAGKVTGIIPTTIDQDSDAKDSLVLAVQTNINRFGPLLIIMFMISILLALYKYDARLSAYYHSRADALEMLDAGVDTDRFDKLATALSPEKYDFGKMPRSPADQAVEIAKSVLSRSP